MMRIHTSRLQHTMPVILRGVGKKGRAKLKTAIKPCSRVNNPDSLRCEPSDSEEGDAAVDDYLANIDAEDASMATKGVHQFVQGCHRDIGEELDGAYLDGRLGSSACSSGSDSDESSSSDEDGSHRSRPSTSAPTSSWYHAGRTGAMSAEQRGAFPYVLNDVQKTDAHGSGRKRKQKSAVKGAMRGKLLPGEKAKLKQERKEAKRAARDASRGFDMSAAMTSLQEFVATGGDMLALEAHGKHSQEFMLKLARTAGCRSSLQGSGNRRVVIVTRPPDLQPLSKAVLTQMQTAVQAELRAQRLGAAAAGCVIPAGMALSASLAGQAKSFPSADRRRWWSRNAEPSGPSAPLQPVLFTPASHTLVDPSSATQIVVVMPIARLPVLAEAPIPVIDMDQGLGQEQGQGEPQGQGQSQDLGQEQVLVPDHPQCQGEGPGQDQEASGQGRGHNQAEGTAAKPGDSDSTGAVPKQAGWPSGGQSCDSTGVALWGQLERQMAANSLHGHGVPPPQHEPRRSVEAGSMGSGPPGGTAEGGSDSEGEVILFKGRSHPRATSQQQLVPPDAAAQGIPGEREGEQEEDLGMLDEEEEPVAHTGLGYTTSAGHVYQRSGFSLGLGASATGPFTPSSDAALATSLGAPSSAHMSCEPSTHMGSGPLMGVEARNGSSRHQPPKAVRLAHPMEPVLNAVPHGDSDAVGPFPTFGVNRTKQQAKAASKKAAKQGRRRQGEMEHMPAQQQWPQDDPVGEEEAATSMGGGGGLSFKFMSFEKHTTGIGSRLMGRMGWSEGMGLGRVKQGRVEPVEALQRPRNLGLGAD